MFKMTLRNVAAVALAGSLLAFSGVGSAKANMITGSFAVAGGLTALDTTANTFTFNPAGITVPTATGDFLTTLGPNGPLTVTVPGGSISYANLNAALGATPLFTITDSKLPTNDVATLTVLTNTFVDINGFAIINGTATLTLTGFDPTPGTFRLSMSQTGDSISFQSNAQAVPGPIVGAGLPGLIAACGGLIALARRRRQKMA